MEKVLISISIDDISREDFENKINNRFHPFLTTAMTDIRKICPSVKVISAEELAQRINDEDTFCNEWIGVISVNQIY